MKSLEVTEARMSPLHLFLISFCALFLEMAAIRWLNASAQILSYFNNLILISSFFGLGVGCLLSKRKIRLINGFSFVFILLIVGVIFLQRHGIEISYKGDFLFARQAMESEGSHTYLVSISAVAGFFINMLFFVIIGQELGKQLNAVNNPLRAYSYDIAGSIIGTLTYLLFVWMHTPPHIWFLFGALLLVAFLPRKIWLIGLTVALICLGSYAISKTHPNAVWSPYYKVTISPYNDEQNRNWGFMIAVDNLRIQDALNFSPGLEKTSLGQWIPYYTLPYELFAPEKVLILGAGSGNEAVVARQYGVKEVQAVEIDPYIAHLGKSRHPQKPYEDPGVSIAVNDGRAYISSCEEQYDLIVMSALDSHKQIAGLSSLRLESYMYTKEAFQQIKKLLKPGGIFCLNVSSSREWIFPRVYWTIGEAFDTSPMLLKSDAGPYPSHAMIAGNNPTLPSDELLAAKGISRLDSPQYPDKGLLCTDDWPFLYLEKNDIPPFNKYVIGIILLLSFGIVVGVEPSARRPNLHYFFLGAGFMLIETRSITQLALLFGMTWYVTSIVVAVILVAIFITNFAVIKEKGISTKMAYPLLLITLIISYLFPFNSLLSLDFLPRLAVSSIIIGLPIIWAGFIFSNSFKHESHVNRAFGSNLLGVVVGGTLEYFCNRWGLSSLYLLAIALYAASFVTKPGDVAVTSPGH